MRIDQATALVTGATGGIGRCLVEALLTRGAKRIYAADLAAMRVMEWTGHPIIIPLDLDITDDQSVAAVAAQGADVTLLVNNAGINLRSPFIAAPSMAAARREMETNYLGTLAMCRAFAPALVRNTAFGGSAIVNMLSILAKVTLPNLGSYCATKAALLRLTEGVRAELGPKGVDVLAVMPWAVDTPLSGPFPGT
jgi:NAD(P)-dependent dehydrogenase (short-subunit alcohol dehydrogenase family)